MPTQNCDLCVHNAQDEDGYDYCDLQLDEDEYARYLARRDPACPYYRPGDEYSLVRKQN